jgi:hypothetical protein
MMFTTRASSQQYRGEGDPYLAPSGTSTSSTVRTPNREREGEGPAGHIDTFVLLNVRRQRKLSQGSQNVHTHARIVLAK